MAAKRKYPWDTWFRRDWFRLTRGIEFPCEPHGMAQQVRNAAAVRGLQVSIHIKHSTLDVTVRHEFILPLRGKS